MNNGYIKCNHSRLFSALLDQIISIYISIQPTEIRVVAYTRHVLHICDQVMNASRCILLCSLPRRGL